MTIMRFSYVSILTSFLLISVFSVSPSVIAQSQLHHVVSEEVCHPTVNATLDQYLIGYGSLISSQSKNRTYQGTGDSLPILLSGFKRGWFARGFPTGFSATFLGIISDQKSKLNGVIFKVPQSSVITEYDAREKMYCRVLVSRDNIQMLNHTPLPSGQFWIYASTPDSIAKSSERYPIVQSYVDVFISGCLEIQKKFQLNNFVNQCIDTTSDWSHHWVNDRIYPRRPFVYQPDAKLIDQVLSKKIPQFYNSIKIE